MKIGTFDFAVNKQSLNDYEGLKAFRRIGVVISDNHFDLSKADNLYRIASEVDATLVGWANGTGYLDHLVHQETDLPDATVMFTLVGDRNGIFVTDSAGKVVAVLFERYTKGERGAVVINANHVYRERLQRFYRSASGAVSDDLIHGLTNHVLVDTL